MTWLSGLEAMLLKNPAGTWHGARKRARQIRQTSCTHCGCRVTTSSSGRTGWICSSRGSPGTQIKRRQCQAMRLLALWSLNQLDMVAARHPRNMACTSGKTALRRRPYGLMGRDQPVPGLRSSAGVINPYVSPDSRKEARSQRLHKA
jgi:hypothetical protein